MKMTLALALAAALFASVPSSVLAYSPSVSIVPQDVYLDDVPGVDYDWACQDIGLLGGGMYYAVIYRNGELLEWLGSCGSHAKGQFLGQFEGMNLNMTSEIIVFDDFIADDDEGYDPYNYEWLMQPGNDWVISTSTVYNHASNRP